MQSTGGVMFRALVMFGFLVVLPVYALFGTSLPQRLEPLLNKLTDVGLEPQSPPASVAPPLENAPVWPPTTAGPSGPAPIEPGPSSSGSNFAGVPWAEPPGDARRSAPIASRSAPTNTGPVAVETMTPAAPAASQAAGNIPRTQVAHRQGRALISDQRYAQLEQQLLELGVSDFSLALETGPGGRRSYVCSCRLGNDRSRLESYSQSDAVTAMSAMVEQIERLRRLSVAQSSSAREFSR